jgi:hypothetical protein
VGKRAYQSARARLEVVMIELIGRPRRWLVQVFGLRRRDRAHAEVGTARTEVGESARRRSES